MAYDNALADRVRAVLSTRGPYDEMAMFGGLAFMVRGAMATGIIGSDLLVRQPPEEADTLLRDPNVRPMDFTGRPMKGWFYVAAGGLSGDKQLESWVDRSVRYVATLPPKKPKASTPKPRPAPQAKRTRA